MGRCEFVAERGLTSTEDVRESKDGGAGGGGPVGGRSTSIPSSFAAFEAVEEFFLGEFVLTDANMGRAETDAGAEGGII